MKNLINKTLANTLGYHFTKYGSKKDKVFEAQKNLSDPDRKAVIFDVGAYTGETALAYNKYFDSRCDIYSFEPFKDSFDLLKENTSMLNNVSLFNFAFGNENKPATFHVNNFLATNSLLPSSEEGIKIWGENTLATKSKIEIPMKTIDHFVTEENIDQIDILKMDTQGAEYLVLEGAKESIRQGKIKVIYSELIVMPIYEGQKELHEMLGLFKDYGYELYNLFTSTDKEGRLKFMDGIFVFKNL